MNSRRVVVLGGGSMGTALSIALARNNNNTVRVSLLMRDAEAVFHMTRTRRNRDYLPSHEVPKLILPSIDPATAFGGPPPCAVFCCVPTGHVASYLESSGPLAAILRGHVGPSCPLVITSRGVDTLGASAYDIIVKSGVAAADNVVVLGGPCFASELAAGKPTTFIAVGTTRGHCESVKTLLPLVSCGGDVRGVAICAAANMCFSMAAGYLSVHWQSNNATCGFMSRCLADLRALLTAIGCDPMTAMSEAGVGDLLLRCSSSQSTSFVLGTRLAQGLSANNVFKQYALRGGGAEVQACVKGLGVIVDSVSPNAPLKLLRAVLCVLTHERRGAELAAIALNPDGESMEFSTPDHETFQQMDVLTNAVVNPSVENLEAKKDIVDSYSAPPPAIRQMFNRT